MHLTLEVLFIIPTNDTILSIPIPPKDVLTIRLRIDESIEHKDIEILIKCQTVDNRLAHVIKQIKQNYLTLIGTKDGCHYTLIADDLYYIESIDNKTFFYGEKEVYECNMKLYSLEQSLEGTQFIRISKNLIVNTSHVKHVRALFNGKFEATLTNGELAIVNRHYAKMFKEKFLD